MHMHRDYAFDDLGRVADRLRVLWDFDDLDSTERRFRSFSKRRRTGYTRRGPDPTGAGAKACADRSTTANASSSRQRRLRARAPWHRADRPRTRTLRRSADGRGSASRSSSAPSRPQRGGELVLAADAAHMAALAAPTRDGIVAWTDAGSTLAESSDDASVRYWLGPLLNNLGWEHFEAGEYTDALHAFERALIERERDPATARRSRSRAMQSPRPCGRSADREKPYRSSSGRSRGPRARMLPTAGSTRSSRRPTPISGEQPKRRTRRGRLSHSCPKRIRRSRRRRRALALRGAEHGQRLSGRRPARAGSQGGCP